MFRKGYCTKEMKLTLRYTKIVLSNKLLYCNGKILGVWLKHALIKQLFIYVNVEIIFPMSFIIFLIDHY